MGERVQEMLAQAEVKPDLKPASQTHPRGDANLASLAMAATAIGMDPETRFLEDRRDEVTSWGVTARGALETAVREQVASQPLACPPLRTGPCTPATRSVFTVRSFVRQQIGRGPTEPAQGCVQAGQPCAQLAVRSRQHLRGGQ